MKKITSLIIALGIGWFGLVPSAQAQSVQDAVKNEISKTQKEKKGFAVQEFRLGTGVAIERWNEDALLAIYGKSSKMIPNVSMSYRFHKHFAIDVEAGSARLTANDERQIFQVVPVSTGASVLFGNQNLEPFIGVGAGFVQFSEKLQRYEKSTPVATYGTKLGVDTKAGLRIGTRSIQDSQHPGAPQSFSQMDVELFMGYRVHQIGSIGTGLNLNAFRAGVGLKFRL